MINFEAKPPEAENFGFRDMKIMILPLNMVENAHFF